MWLINAPAAGGSTSGCRSARFSTAPQLAEIRGLARALEAYGARVELLVDGSLVAALVDARGQ